MGNKGATGPFAPLVVAIRNVYGTKNFNLLRGKAISLHSQGRFLEERELQSASKGGRGASECASEEELSGRGRCEKRRGRRRGRRGGRRRRNSRQRDLFLLFLFLTKQLHHFLWKKKLKTHTSHQGVWQVDRRRHEAGAGPHPPGEEERGEARVPGLKWVFLFSFLEEEEERRERERREKRKKETLPPGHREKPTPPPRASQPAEAATPSHYSFVFIRFSPLQELAFFLFCFLVKSSPFCLQFPRLSPTPPLSLSPHSKHPTASASLARDPAGPCARRRAPCRSLWKRGSSPRRPQRRRRRRGRPQARKRWRSSSSLLLFLFLLLLLLLLTTTLALLCRLLARARRGRPGRVSRKNEGKEVEGKVAW